MENDKVKQLFAGLQSSLVSSLGLSQVHTDPNARGDNSELSWHNMLSANLPSRYKVDKGFVIDSTGSQSDSLDLIIYDSFYSTYVFNENGIKYIPAESVYAVFECKQVLDRGHIEYSANKAASVRRLERTSLPITQINGKLIAKVDKGIITGVLTTRSDWSPPLGESLKTALKDFADFSKLEIGCSLEDGSFSVTYDDTDVHVVVSEPEEALISFYINLVTKLQQLGNAPAIDLAKYYQTAKQQ